MHGLGRNRLAPTAALLVLAVAFVACGGNGDKTSDGAITERQFLVRGDRICQEVFGRITRRYSKLIGYVTARSAPSDAREREMNVGTQRFIVPAIAELVHRLRALGAPPGQQDRLAKTLASLEAGIQRAEKDSRAARGSLGVEFAFQEGYELLPALGLLACKQG